MRLNIAANNFDLLRLCAALQVAILHVARELSPQYGSAPWVGVLEVFSGVPIFFFISGFLISRSYERSKSLTDYALNRTLRIFPALHVCVLLNIIAIALTGYFTAAGADPLRVIAQSRELILEYHFRFVQQAADQGGLAVVHRAAGNEAQQALALMSAQVLVDVARPGICARGLQK